MSHTSSLSDAIASDGLVVVAKKDCPTCALIAPVYRQLADSGMAVSVFTQDDPTFPDSIPDVIDDTDLAVSYKLHIETVPTLIRMRGGREVARTFGWDRAEWEKVSGIMGLGTDLPEFRPGCGAKNVDPGMPEKLAIRFGDANFTSREIPLGAAEDPIETAFERGWSDGLPVVPPTPERVLRMLQGTMRDPDEVIGNIPPNLAPCTVEKVAINAVMAGCKPEYLPVVLAAVEAALIPEFCMHGLLCTTYFSGPVVIVNGPVAKAIGMNSGVNALGQGNRANSTIGRALQLVIRNVGGGEPGGIDRSTLGTPGKVGFCFAEDESDDFWKTLAAERGVAPDRGAVTLYAGDGVMPCADELSREPDSLVRSLAMSLRCVGHPKRAKAHDALLVMSPEHVNVFRRAGWSKRQVKDALDEALMIPAREIMRGANGVASGIKADDPDALVPKFRPGGLNIVRAGGQAGLFSAIIGGWAATGERGSELVTREIGI